MQYNNVEKYVEAFVAPHSMICFFPFKVAQQEREQEQSENWHHFSSPFRLLLKIITK